MPWHAAALICDDTNTAAKPLTAVMPPPESRSKRITYDCWMCSSDSSGYTGLPTILKRQYQRRTMEAHHELLPAFEMIFRSWTLHSPWLLSLWWRRQPSMHQLLPVFCNRAYGAKKGSLSLECIRIEIPKTTMTTKVLLARASREGAVLFATEHSRLISCSPEVCRITRVTYSFPKSGHCKWLCVAVSGQSQASVS